MLRSQHEKMAVDGAQALDPSDKQPAASRIGPDDH